MIITLRKVSFPRYYLDCLVVKELRIGGPELKELSSLTP